MMNVKSSTRPRLALNAISIVVSALETTRPNIGVSRPHNDPNRRGNNPSLAVASGTCAEIRIQPFNAPKQATAAPIATTIDAQSPTNIRAASANGAVDTASWAAGT